MDTQTFDMLVVGAGMAGATAAAHLAADHRVALIEAEDQAGYHSTGRSAAIWILNYGPPEVMALTGASRTFFEHPPPGFADAPLMSRRPILFLAPEAGLADMHKLLTDGSGVVEISVDEARRLVPALRQNYALRAATEADSFDMDVAGLHQGFLRQLRARGGVVALRSRTGRIFREGGLWTVEVTGGATFRARVLVDAAGAWGDEVAIQAGVRPIGLVPKRRTGVIVDAAPWRPEHWPMVHDVSHTWYMRTEARTKLMVSPADETDMTPHDVQPDEIDVAVAIDRMQQAIDLDIRRIEHSWAGLRTFSPDRNLVFGWDADAPGFFWVVGQGGYGIQTAPAAGRLVADLISDRDPGEVGRILPAIDPKRFSRQPAMA